MSYRDTVSDRNRHHGRLSETQEAIYAVFILHMKKYFGQLDTDLKNKTKKTQTVVYNAICKQQVQAAQKDFLRFPSHLSGCEDILPHQIFSSS